MHFDFSMNSKNYGFVIPFINNNYIYFFKLLLYHIYIYIYIYNIFNIYGISTKWEGEKKNLERRRREYNEDEDGVRVNEAYLLTINEEKLRMYKSWHEKSS